MHDVPTPPPDTPRDRWIGPTQLANAVTALAGAIVAVASLAKYLL